MRDLVVREALMDMSRDAAKRLRELVAAGEEIPYDVREAGAGSPLPRYTPLTERFVQSHSSELRALDSFGSACAAIESAGLAGPYLEELGVKAPPDSRARAELAGIVFLARLWTDSTDFSLDDQRLRAAIAEVESYGDAEEGEIEVVVPLRGLRMEASRLELAPATIVRADTVEVPAEARASEASGGAGWEPTFLAVARVNGSGGDEDGGAGPDAGTRSVAAFRELITTLRLFKSGGVALGAHAWTRIAGGRWRRISTGSGRPRPGGYRLGETELSALAGFSRAAHTRIFGTGGGARVSGLDRAISRFEAGLERTVALDALNDYLLALRFLLEGGGPASLGLSMRVASLCAEPDGRSDVKGAIDRALALERQLWSGEPPSSSVEGPTPAETALDVEELTRAILKDSACGHLGTDLRATADEILLADGLAVGDGAAAQRGGTAEWAAGDAEDGVTPVEEAVEPDAPADQADADSVAVVEPGAEGIAEDEAEPRQDSFEWVIPPRAEPEPEGPRYGREAPVLPGSSHASDDGPGGELKVIGEPRRITMVTTVEEEETTVMNAEHAPEPRHEPRGDENPVVRLLALRSEERERTQSRVANLFPPPETTEWDVREISYDRSRRARVGDHAS